MFWLRVRMNFEENRVLLVTYVLSYANSSLLGSGISWNSEMLVKRDWTATCRHQRMSSNSFYIRVRTYVFVLVTDVRTERNICKFPFLCMLLGCLLVSPSLLMTFIYHYTISAVRAFGDRQSWIARSVPGWVTAQRSAEEAVFLSSESD